MKFTRSSDTEFTLEFGPSDELRDHNAGLLLVPNARLRKWLQANTVARGVIKANHRCTVWMKFAPEKVEGAERFLTLIRVMGLQALETSDEL